MGLGLFAIAKISKGEVIIDYSNAPGKFLTTKEADALFEKGNDYMMQIDEDSFFVATNREELESSDFINHSCNPNCGIKNKFKIIAMRDIDKKEEITIDYAMCESSEYEMPCQCKNKNCRKVITGNDWKIKSLQEKYNGFFSDYLQRLIF